MKNQTAETVSRVTVGVVYLAITAGLIVGAVMFGNTWIKGIFAGSAFLTLLVALHILTEEKTHIGITKNDKLES